MTIPKNIEPPNPSSISVKDPRYPIWGRIFMCRMPRISHYSTKYLEEYGMHTSGNLGVDRALALQPQLVYITINAMVEHFHQSSTVRIVRRDDIRTIYEICQDYIFDWAEIIERGVMSHRVPFADLIKIDEFSEAVYQYAAVTHGDEFARTFINEGAQKNAKAISDMFAAVDKKIKKAGRKKDDSITVHTVYTPVRKNRDVDEVVLAKPLELPDRPTPRELFLSYMNRSGHASELK